MPKDFSFDIECKFNLQELKNAIDNSKREIASRFDFKGVLAEIELSDDKITINTESEPKIEAIKQVLISKIVKREQSPSILDWSKKEEKTTGMNLRKEVKLIKALDQDTLKKISKLIRENLKKVKTNIHGDTVRVESPSKNDLQEVMDLIRKDETIDAPIMFTNFR